ncbi:putative uncharacterized protein MED14OS [Muntiacus reevesi]|uniref:putative uncharacterized protein MED14OS n=1 Tax=Muntiacus reevesi TaxID=9886 RepID=UPI0033074FA5
MRPSNLPPGRSVTAPKWARAESPPPPTTAEPPQNRKPYAGRRGPPPCSDEPAGSRDWSEGRGEGGEAGRQPQRSSAPATVQRPLGQAAAASILTAQSGSR